MARINGVEIKSLKNFKGHEGEDCYQGNIYLHGKKIGFWSMDTWGGMDHYSFDEKLLEKAVLSYKSMLEINEEIYSFFDTDLFLQDLLSLTLCEKNYKEFCTSNRPYMLLEFVHGSGFFICKGFQKKEQIHQHEKDLLKMSLKDQVFVGMDTLKEYVISSKDEFNWKIGSNEDFERELAKEKNKKIVSETQNHKEEKKKKNFTERFDYIIENSSVIINDKKTGKGIVCNKSSLDDIINVVETFYN